MTDDVLVELVIPELDYPQHPNVRLAADGLPDDDDWFAALTAAVEVVAPGSDDVDGVLTGDAPDDDPLLPVAAPEDLGGPDAREAFVERLHLHARWRSLLADPSAGGLVAFHTAEKMLLLAHDPDRYRELGRITANAGKGDLDDRLEEYRACLAEALDAPTTKAKHVTVLEELAGYLDGATDEERRAADVAITAYSDGRAPRVLAVTTLRRLFWKPGAHSWPAQQTYLAPYPDELAP